MKTTSTDQDKPRKLCNRICKTKKWKLVSFIKLGTGSAREIECLTCQKRVIV